jgi:pimeloyl-ACP methyl ester carboxylesterase
MPIVDFGDCRLEYRIILGDPALPPLVFLHEGLGSAGLWRDFPDTLARRIGARALIYSRAGYGRSSGLAAKRTARYLHDEALDVLPRLLAKLGISKPILIGHSDGASISLIHAAHYPGDVTGIVLMAPHVFVESISLSGIASASELYETGGLRERLAKHHDLVDDAFHGWAGTWLSPTFDSWSLGAEVEMLRTPTLLIQGDDDNFGTLAQLDAFEAARNAKVTRLVLRGCGHAPHRDAEAKVIEAVAGFVAGV